MLLLLYVLVDVEVAREEDAIEEAKVCCVELLLVWLYVNQQVRIESKK